MKKSIIYISFIMVLFEVCASGQNAKKSFKAGEEFVKNNKYEDAIEQFTSAINLEPSNAEFYFARAKAYEELVKYSEARSDYEKAIVFDPKNADYLISLGVLCNKMGNYEEALRLLNYVSGRDKRNSKVYPVKVITLIGLGMYEQALKVSDTAIIIKDTPMDYYYRGLIYRKINNDIFGKRELEKAISKDRRLAEPRLELADLLIDSDPGEAMNQCNEVLRYDDRNTKAYLVRSKIYMKNLDFPSAINDISKTILIDPDNPEFYLERGKCYQQFNQHTNAINDFSKYISLVTDDPDAYFSRAKSYEEIMNFDKAIDDYNQITVLSKYDVRAREMLDAAQTRLYELNRETVAPEITIISPAPVNNVIEIRGDKDEILISGKIIDKSKIPSFLINDRDITTAEKNGEYEFLSNIDVRGMDKLTFVARDDYGNEKVINYPIVRTEINPPKITLLSPYTTDERQILLDRIEPKLFIEGKITDDSRIKSIYIDNSIANYERDPNNLEISAAYNPVFSATIDIANKNKINVIAEDIYGNRVETEFILNREGALLAESNPMGRTWVVFIENSSYESFAALDGPIKDVSTIQRALTNYDIHNIIHMRDMKKAEMERYFNIELRDLVRKNQVKSLLVWYAGHGKFINDIGYWIPVDAKRDDEFTYFNINALKAGLQGYGQSIIHTLVVSDACESGPGFYTTMRSTAEEPTCDNTIVAGAKSAQVFSSAGYQLATDDSKFTATFANTLVNNKNACIPIETIVKSVTAAVSTDNGQQPRFGKIQGLEDMNGTFFFIAK